MHKLFIEDLAVQSKRVFIRVDFNVPIEDGRVADDTRIKAALPTIRFVIERGGRAVLASHLGRPKGTVVASMRMDPVAVRLGELLGRNIRKLDDCIGNEIECVVAEMKDGDIVLLENLRFHKEETENETAFSQGLARLADLYVNDAFGAVHRAHASIVGITGFISRCACGYLMKKELEYLGQVLTDPAHPFVAILGGAKVSGKIAVIENLMDKVDAIVVGGGMAYTFLEAQGLPTGNSLVERERLDTAKGILEHAQSKGVAIFLPEDHVVVQDIKEQADSKVVKKGEIEKGWMGVDIGPGTIEVYKKAIQKAETIVWNGPMGIFEVEPFSRGTYEIGRAVADSSALSVVGGGDSVAAVNRVGIANRITHISTGGGASLEFLEGKELPGITALTDKDS